MKSQPSGEHIERRVLEIVAGLAPVRAGDTSLATELLGDLGYNSLQLIELAVTLEDAFDLDVELESVEQRIITVGDVVDLVRAFVTEAPHRDA